MSEAGWRRRRERPLPHVAWRFAPRMRATGAVYGCCPDSEHFAGTSASSASCHGRLGLTFAGPNSVEKPCQPSSSGAPCRNGRFVMNMSSVLSTSVVAMLAMSLSATPSEAQPHFNTFVVSDGSGNLCTRLFPCTHFQTAHDATIDGGNITCLDS